jgi:hypothetical protein
MEQVQPALAPSQPFANPPFRRTFDGGALAGKSPSFPVAQGSSPFAGPTAARRLNSTPESLAV